VLVEVVPAGDRCRRMLVDEGGQAIGEGGGGKGRGGEQGARERGRNAAWLGVVGFGLVLFTYLGTRLLGGYHVFG